MSNPLRTAPAHLPGVHKPRVCVRCPDIYPDRGDWCEACRWGHAMEFARAASRAERAAELEAVVREYYESRRPA